MSVDERKAWVRAAHNQLQATLSHLAGCIKAAKGEKRQRDLLDLELARENVKMAQNSITKATDVAPEERPNNARRATRGRRIW